MHPSKVKPLPVFDYGDTKFTPAFMELINVLKQVNDD